MLDFLKESRDELRKVVWPTREEVLNSTVVVLGAVVVISLFLYFVDHAFEFVFEFVVGAATRSS
ncbi:MAG: preprotein translocase subunit SecE [Spirochaetia bacterium]|nr:preprotein translocase subunit SecE [Spirochaetia bacterium]